MARILGLWLACAVLVGSVAAWPLMAGVSASATAESSSAVNAKANASWHWTWAWPWFGKVPFETIHQGQYDYFGFDKPTHRVVRNATAFKELWMSGQNLQERPVPFVDFSKRMVVAVFAGTKNTGGYSIEVRRVLQTPWALYVFVQETSPGAGCFVTQALTDPNHMVMVPTSDVPVKVIRHSQVRDC